MLISSNCFLLNIIYFNLINFLIFSSQAPNENEMFEIMQNSNTQGSNNTNQSESTIADDTLTDRQQVK